MNSHRKEIVVTIVCAVCVAITAVLSARIARDPVTKFQVRLVPSSENVPVTDYFPLRVGNSWEYVGAARNATEGNIVVEKKVLATMRVKSVTHGGNATLFSMEGHPSDAVWALQQADVSKEVVQVPPSTYAFLVIANKVFRIPEGRIENIKESLESGGHIGPNLVSQEDLAFEFPLYRGLAFGSAHHIARNDRSYAWHVTDSTLYHAPDREAIREVPRYKLVYLTFPDYSEMSFIPYLGIVSYSYSHHGTTGQVDIYLEDYSVHVDS